MHNERYSLILSKLAIFIDIFKYYYFIQFYMLSCIIRIIHDSILTIQKGILILLPLKRYWTLLIFYSHIISLLFNHFASAYYFLFPYCLLKSSIILVVYTMQRGIILIYEAYYNFKICFIENPNDLTCFI